MVCTIYCTYVYHILRPEYSKYNSRRILLSSRFSAFDVQKPENSHSFSKCPSISRGVLCRSVQLRVERTKVLTGAMLLKFGVLDRYLNICKLSPLQHQSKRSGRTPRVKMCLYYGAPLYYSHRQAGDKQTGRQADRQTCRQADMQTGRQADRQTGRQADTRGNGKPTSAYTKCIFLSNMFDILSRGLYVEIIGIR